MQRSRNHHKNYDGSISTYHSHSDAKRRLLVVEQALQEEDDGSGHGLGQLVGAHRVELQGEVGEHHEPAEGGGEWEEPHDGHPLGLEDVEPDAELQAQGGGEEVYQRQGHAGEVVQDVHQLVQHDDADGRGHVDPQAEGDGELGRHSA